MPVLVFIAIYFVVNPFLSINRSGAQNTERLQQLVKLNEVFIPSQNSGKISFNLK